MIRKNNKIIIIASIITVVIIAIMLLMLFLVTDIFKSPEQLFYKYVGQNSKILEIFESETYELLNEKKKIAPYNAQGEISVNQVSGDVIEESTNNIETELFKVVTEGKNDLLNKKQYNNITLVQNDNRIFNMKYLRTGDKYALTSDEIVTAYVAVDNNNLKELFKKLGISEENLANIPDKIENTDIAGSIEFTEEEKEQITNIYTNLITKSITKEKFSKNGNVYTLTLTNVEIKNIILNILNTVQNDNTTLNILLNKYNKVANNGMTLENLKLQISNLIEKVNKIELAKTENISINLYVNNGNLLKTEIVTLDGTTEIEFSTTQEKITITQKTISTQTYFNNIEITKIETDNEYSLNILINNVNNAENKDSISFQISSVGNINSNDIRQLNILKINLSGKNYTFTQSNNITFETLLEIEELNDENSVTINNYNEQELKDLITALRNRINQVIMEKANMLNTSNNINSEENVGQSNENTDGANEQVEEPISEEQQAIDTFNEQFTPYLGEAVQGEKVKSLLQNVKTAVQNGNNIKVGFSGVYNNTAVQKQGATPEEIEEMLIYVIMSKNYFVEGLADTTGKLAELTIKENT